jgi:hypothetical protein
MMRNHSTFTKAVITVLLETIWNQPATAREPTLEQALKASAEDLAISYLTIQAMIQMTELAAMGVQIVTPEGRLTKNNAAKLRQKYEARRQRYADAVAQRGHAATLAGTYGLVSADPVCSRTYSTLLATATEEGFGNLEIIQDGPDITLVMNVSAPDGEPSEQERDISLKFEGATVEDAVAVVDPLNSDYIIAGKLTGTSIEWRARPEVLRGWPKWAPAPTQANLANCRVVVRRVD